MSTRFESLYKYVRSAIDDLPLPQSRFDYEIDVALLHAVAGGLICTQDVALLPLTPQRGDSGNGPYVFAEDLWLPENQVGDATLFGRVWVRASMLLVDETEFTSFGGTRLGFNPKVVRLAERLWNLENTGFVAYDTVAQAEVWAGLRFLLDVTRGP